MSLLPVVVDGAHLKTTDGKPFKAVGTSEFGLFRRWLIWTGPDPRDFVKPILDERKSLAVAAGYDGPLVARVFRYANPAWNSFGVLPWSYPMGKMADFTHFLGEQDWYVDWTCGDSQYVIPLAHGPQGQQEHLNQSCATQVGCSNSFCEQTSNEAFKNGIDVAVVRPPKWGTYLTDSGMYRDDNSWDHSVDLEVIDFHPDRSDDQNHTVPKFVGKLFESAVYLVPLAKPIIYKEPIGADEINKPGKRCNDPRLWAQMGLSIGLTDGIYFHSTPGLASDGYGPVVKECFKSFCRGVVGGLKT